MRRQADTPYFVALLSPLLLGGCVAFPPMKLGGGIAASGQGASIVPAAHLVANIRPLALAEALRDRPADVSVGVFGEYADRDRVHVNYRGLAGPTVGVEGYPVTWPTPDNIGRLVVGGELRALYQPGVDSWGPFVAERVGIEVASYVEGCEFGGGTGGFGIGCGAGEGGIGIFFEMAQGYLGERFRFSGAFLVEVRIPGGFAGGIPFPK